MTLSKVIALDVRKSVRKNVKQVIVDVLDYKNGLAVTESRRDPEDDIHFSSLGDMFADLEEYKP